MTTPPEHHDTPSDEKPKKVIVITDADSVVLHKKLRIGRLIVRASYISLLVLFSLLNIINENGKLALWLLQIIPLLIFCAKHIGLIVGCVLSPSCILPRLSRC